MLQDAVKRHARHAGEIIWCWNILHDQLFELLAALLIDRAEVRARLVAYAMWTPIQSDSLKRELVKEVAAGVLTSEPKVLDAVNWLLDRTSDLATHRNDVAHVPVKFAFIGAITGRPPRVMLSPMSGSGRKAAIDRLLGQPTAETWRRVRGDLMALSRYAFFLSSNIRGIERAPWPRKPRLLCVQAKKKKRPKKGRRKQPKSPPPPPSS